MKPTPEAARGADVDAVAEPTAADADVDTDTATDTAADADADAADPVARAERDLLGHLGAEVRHGHASRAALSAQIQTLRDERDRALAALAHSRAREALAWERAYHDTLTGLPNRLGFEAAWQQALASHATGSRVFALLFIDLDGFKALNDRLGHAAGDELLAIVGARLAHALRRGDAVCRHGGDEFLCLLTQLRDPREAHRIADWLLHTIAAPCRLQAAPRDAALVSVRPSIGIAYYPRDGRTAATLIERADTAMYRAKAGHLGIADLAPAARGGPAPTTDGAGTVAGPRGAAAAEPRGAADAEPAPPTGLARRGLSRPSGPSPREAAAGARAGAAPARHRSSRRLRNPG